MQEIAKNSPSGHHRTSLLGYIFATKACIDTRKKLLNSNISPTCPHNTVNFDPLTAEIRSGVWSVHPSRASKSSTSFGWGKGWNVTSDGWQVTPCDPIWYVSSSSGVATSVSKLLYPCYLLTYIPQQISTGFASWQRYCTAP